MALYLTIASIFFALFSAAAWLRASIVKVSRDEEVAYRMKKAKKLGVEPNLAGACLDGWDMSGTFRAQSSWNAIGALLAAISIFLQAIVQALQNV